MRARHGLPIAVMVALLAWPAVGHAAWLAVGAGDGTVRADEVPRGAQPTVTVDGASMTVSWDEIVMSDGTAVDSYVVQRHPVDTDDAIDPGTACDEAVETTACTEEETPPGTWRYSVRPRIGSSWAGARSDPSEPISTEIQVHVAALHGDVDTAGTGNDRTWSAYVTVTVRDSNGGAVSGVVVEGAWTTDRDPEAETGTCVTEADGRCEVSAEQMRQGGGNEATFAVEGLSGDGVVHAGSQDVYSSIILRRNGQATCEPVDCPA